MGTKASRIRNPAVRYAHKVLATTFYARREANKVKDDEMVFLIEGIKPKLDYLEDKTKICGGLREISIAAIFCKQLMWFKNWGWTHTDKDPQWCMGGIITPILEYCEIDLGPCSEPIERHDAKYLNRTHFLSGCVGEKHVYKFSIDNEEKKILLPNKELTSFTSRDNIIFMPSESLFIHNYVDTPVVALYKSKKGKSASTRATSQPSTSQQGPSVRSTNHHDTFACKEDFPQDNLSLGNERFYFHPMEGPFSSNGLQRAHEQTKLLLQWNKMQDKAIHNLEEANKKLKKKYKHLREALQSLHAKFKKGSSHKAKKREVVEDSSDEDLDYSKRHSSVLGHKRKARRSLTPPSSDSSRFLSTDSEDSQPSTSF